jgi:hypothetical protein
VLRMRTGDWVAGLMGGDHGILIPSYMTQILALFWDGTNQTHLDSIVASSEALGYLITCIRAESIKYCLNP